MYFTHCFKVTIARVFVISVLSFDATHSIPFINTHFISDLHTRVMQLSNQPITLTHSQDHYTLGLC